MQKPKWHFFDRLRSSGVSQKTVKKLNFIHECKGKQDLFVIDKPEVLKTLLRVAMINSTVSSNAIENIVVSEKKVKALIEKRVKPKNRDEEEALGYKDVLHTIHESYEHIPVKPNYILQFHRDLFAHVKVGGNYGKWKMEDNYITEEKPDGNKQVRFVPTPAYEVQDAMNELCNRYNEEIKKQEIEPLLLIAEFIFVFLCIHPFDDGNGRVSRLLTLLLMHQNGYTVAKYISIEKITERTKKDYYQALYDSSKYWDNQKYDSSYFTSYFLFLVSETYNSFLKKAINVTNVKKSKYQLIKEYFDNHIGKVTKSDIKESLPNISETTIERTLKILINKKVIEKFGDRKFAYYVKKSSCRLNRHRGKIYIL